MSNTSCIALTNLLTALSSLSLLQIFLAGQCSHKRVWSCLLISLKLASHIFHIGKAFALWMDKSSLVMMGM